MMDEAHKARWEIGKHKSLWFYKKRFQQKVEEFNRALPLASYLIPLIGDKKEVKIAELGAGMLSVIGSIFDGVKVKIYPSDLLANEYNQLLKDNSVTPLIPVERQDMENLSYPDNFFDIVHCVNALDHSVNPLRSIKEMYRVCKTGGYIYLRHFPNVGEMEGYWGLHFWNINIDANGNCIIWNPDKKFLLSDHFEGFKTRKGPEEGLIWQKWIISILQKK